MTKVLQAFNESVDKMNIKKAYIIRICYICILLSCCLISSCQSTPEDEAIVEKRPITEIAETVTEDKEKSIMPGDIPERWDEEIEKPESKIKIIFRAEIDAPEEAEISIDKYTTGHYDDDMLQNHLKYLLGEEYDKVKFLKWPNDVKQGYIDELISYKRGAEVDGRIVTPPDDDPEIKLMEEAIAATPDDKNEYIEPMMDYDIPSSYNEYNTYKSKGKNYFSVLIVGGKLDQKRIYCHNYIPDEEFYTGLSFGGEGVSETRLEDPDVMREFEGDWEKIKEAISSVQTDRETAINKAKQVIEYLYPDDEYVVEKCVRRAFAQGRYEWIQDYGQKCDGYVGGYMVSFVLQSSDNVLLPLSSDENTGFINSVKNPYTMPTYSGSITIGIVDGELYSYSENLKHYDGTVSENIGILPFDEVQERIKKIYSYNSVLDKVYGVDRAVVEVDKMILRMTYTRNEGDEVSIYSTPVWCVYGKYHMYKENGELSGSMDYNIMINAIDGSNMGH